MPLQKINQQKPQLNRIRRPERGGFTSCDDSRAQQEEEKFIFFPGKDPTNKYPRSLFTK